MSNVLNKRAESAADRYLARKYREIVATEEMIEAAEGVVERILAMPSSSEESRREVEAELNGIFSGSWTPEVPGLSLITAVSEGLGATSSGEPGCLLVCVDDRAFDSDPDGYAIQLRAAAIGALAGALTGQSVTEMPTPEVITLAAELAVYVSRMSGKNVWFGGVLDTQKFGLSSFSDYLAAGGEELDQRFVCSDLTKFVDAGIPHGIADLFASDGGARQLIPDSVLHASLEPDEINAIGEIEAATVGEERAEGVQQILAQAAMRLRMQGVR